MIVFGSRTRVTGISPQPIDVPCDHCAEKSLRAVVVQGYMHVFWIPFVPGGKQVHFQCGHCKRSIAPKERWPALEPFVTPARAAVKTPPHWFLGLALLVALVGVGYVGIRLDERHTRDWLAAPAVDDYYVIDLRAMRDAPRTEFHYVIGRVRQVDGAQLAIQFSSMGYAQPNYAKRAIEHGDVRKVGFFEGDDFPLPREQLASWHAKGRVPHIIRD